MQQGSTHSDEAKVKISVSQRRRWAKMTPEQRARFARGCKHTEETKAKLAAKQRAAWTPERRATASERMKLIHALAKQQVEEEVAAADAADATEEDKLPWE